MRPIDADAFLKDILTAGIGKTVIEYSECDIGYMIRKRPTIDAVPVVRCRELPCPYNGACSARKVWERLKAYEDTGLEPEQCENAKNIVELAFIDDMAKVERIRKLLKTDKEGRLVVLPEGGENDG